MSRNKKKKNSPPVTIDTELTKNKWREAIEKDMWCEQCDSPLLHDDEKGSFCIVCFCIAEAFRNGRKDAIEKMLMEQIRVDKRKAEDEVENE